MFEYKGDNYIMKKKLTFINEIHNTSVSIFGDNNRIGVIYITPKQLARVITKLCPHWEVSDCNCGGYNGVNPSICWFYGENRIMCWNDGFSKRTIKEETVNDAWQRGLINASECEILGYNL